MKLKKCNHNGVLWVEDRYECPKCELTFEKMANGMIRQICDICGERHWR